MTMLSEAERVLYMETAGKLKGPDRRLFMARTVKLFAPGGKTLVARELGWCPDTILKVGQSQISLIPGRTDGRSIFAGVEWKSSERLGLGGRRLSY